MSILLGLSGAIGSGKTTFASYLAEVEPSHAVYETWHVVAQIATAFNAALRAELAFETARSDLELVNQTLIWLPDAISECLHFDVVWNQLAITKKAITDHYELYEKLFIYLAAARENPKLVARAITTKNKEDYRPLLQWIGGYLVAKISKTIWYDELFRRIDIREKDTNLVIIIGVRYPSDAEVIKQHGGLIATLERPNFTSTKDITEASRDAIKSDYTIVNNGSLKDLRLAAEDFYNQLKAGPLY